MLCLLPSLVAEAMQQQQSSQEIESGKLIQDQYHISISPAAEIEMGTR
jgi:hypothetical protein